MNTKTLINAGKMTLLVNARQIEQNDRKGNEIKWRREKNVPFSSRIDCKTK